MKDAKRNTTAYAVVVMAVISISILLLAGNAISLRPIISPPTARTRITGPIRQLPGFMRRGWPGARARLYPTRRSRDSFILRGGDTWYPSGAGTPIGLPWSWYYGWNGPSAPRSTSGSIRRGIPSWARPVLSGRNPLSAEVDVASCAYHVLPICYDPVSSHGEGQRRPCTGDNGDYGDGQYGF